MSIFQSIKESKPFFKKDLIVYLLVILLTVSFIVIVNITSTPNDKVECLYNGQKVFDYDFAVNNLKLYSVDGVTVTQNTDGDALYLTLTYSDGGFNKVKLDKKQKSASVSESNCSQSKDCVHSPAIVKSGQSVICVPHGLVLKSANTVGTPNQPSVG